MSAALTFPPRKFARTDLGNAERFVARHGGGVRYLPAWRKWLLWDGKRWAIDETLGILRLAKDTVRAMYREASELEKADEREALVKHAVQSEKEAKLRAMLALAQAEPGVAVRPAELDADPWLLSVENGTIDLRTAQLRDHAPADLITKLVPASFDPEARCDRWESFLARVTDGSAELTRFLQKAVGYSLTGLTSARVLFFLYGSGANGKSTFLEVLRALLAGYASQADFTTFLDRKGDGPRNDIARLFSARVVTSSEVGEGKRLDESLVKTLTGDETITARFLHAEFFEFHPTFKLWLAANHRPVIKGTDNAIWDRVRLIPFTVSIPLEERDANLRAALLAELSGILAWAVAGCRLWQTEGLGAPSMVTEATDQYRRDSDTLGAFLEDSCELGTSPMHAEPATQLYNAYAAWCKEGGEYQLSQTRFGRELDERGITAEKRGRGNARVKWRIGLRLTVDALTHSNGARASASHSHDHAQEALSV